MLEYHWQIQIQISINTEVLPTKTLKLQDLKIRYKRNLNTTNAFQITTLYS
ncbi:hypothetical protein SAMN05444355_11332 [Flavobacterium frigoris]|uniref:Uncharacterized protein n=1 Tax=Flavobacterium frigoris TaxID=229204 RepID=A0A1H9PG47_FLAFI|nr:hypothetical protein SAMN05444355_11332 [Flavobacterium frigoris]